MRKFGLALLVACIGLFAACSDDDKTPNDNATAVAGTYKSVLKIKVPGQDVVTSEKDFTLTRTGDNLVTIELKDFEFVGINVGNIVLPSITVNKTSTGYTLAEKTTDVKLADGAIDAKITSNGTVVGNKIIIDLSIDATGFDEPILVDLEGSKSGAKSTMANITAITFAGDFVVAQPIIGDKTDLVLYINDATTAEQLKEVVVTIATSEKATVAPATGTKVDLSSGSAKFTVTAEDGVTKKEYTLKTGKQNVSFYNFNEWIETGTGLAKRTDPTGVWACSNAGIVSMILNGSIPKFTVSESTEGYEGSAARLETVKNIKPSSLLPGLTPGSIFTGVFKLNTMKPLLSTKFGLPFAKKPLKIRGYYKYTAGTPYYTCTDPTKPNIIEVNESITDKASISVVLYEYDAEKAAADEALGTKNPYSTYLTGADIKTSEMIVASATFVGGNVANFAKFEKELTYKGRAYDPAKSYRLAILASASFDGDNFNGADGSVLLLDNVEIIAE